MSYSNSPIEYPTLDTFTDQGYSNINSILNYSSDRINDNLQQPLPKIPSINQQLNQMQYSPSQGSQTPFSPGIQTPPSQIVPPQILPTKQIYTNFPQATQSLPVLDQNSSISLQNQIHDNLNPENQRLIQILNTAVNIANEQDNNDDISSTSNYQNLGNEQNNKPSTSNYKNNLKTLSKIINKQTNRNRRSSRSRKSIKTVDKKINRSKNEEKKCRRTSNHKKMIVLGQNKKKIMVENHFRVKQVGSRLQQKNNEQVLDQVNVSRKKRLHKPQTVSVEDDQEDLYLNPESTQ